MSKHRTAKAFENLRDVRPIDGASISGHQQPQVGHEEIARLAYLTWEEHGRPDGTAEQDWQFAEQQLRGA